MNQTTISQDSAVSSGFVPGISDSEEITDSGTDSTPNTDTSDNSPDSEVRHRTSPRTKAFDEVLKLISDYITANGEDGSLSDISAKVNTLRDTPAPDANPNAGKKHYVGQRATGELVHVMFSGHVSKTGKGKDFSHMYGPFRFKGGALYVVEKGVREGEKRVF